MGISCKVSIKKRATRVCAVVLLVILFCAASYGWLVALVANMEDGAYAVIDNADVIIVLGAQVKAWGEPSEALLRRMTLALDHYKLRPRPIISCGGQGADEPMAEGDFMRDWFVNNGVPEDMAISENKSVNTRQNIANAKKIMGERGYELAMVITSDYHLPRALTICHDLGVAAIGDGSPSRPDLWWKNHIREGLSWIKYKLGL